MASIILTGGTGTRVDGSAVGGNARRAFCGDVSRCERVIRGTRKPVPLRQGFVRYFSMAAAYWGGRTL
jgi:hypothetical protein